MEFRNFSIFFFILLITISAPTPIFCEIGISFSTGYGLPLPFEYAGNTFSDNTLYKEIWTSFGKGLKLNLQANFPINSTLSIISGVDATLLGSCLLPKSSDTYNYHDKYSQSLGGLYGGIEAVGYVHRWLISISVEPGIYYPCNVTVLRQYRIDDQYTNGRPEGSVISDNYQCYYHYALGFSSNFRLGYKISRKSFVFFSVRPTFIHASIKGYTQNIDGKETYYKVGDGVRKPFVYSLDSDIRKMFPIDFSSLGLSVGVELNSKNISQK
jgi:hypothetical protein